MLSNPKVKALVDSFNKNEKKLDINELRFIYDQAEKQLKETIDASSIIVARCTVLISICVAIATTIVSFYIKARVDAKQLDTSVDAICKIGVFFLSLISALLAYNITSKDYYCLGTEPMSLIDTKILDKKEASDKKLVRFYVNEIINQQHKIDGNKSLNKKRWLIFHVSIVSIISVPILMAIFFAFFMN